MNLIPENNMERILNGENVTPNNRTEYFVKQAIDNAGSGGGGGGDEETITINYEIGNVPETSDGYVVELEDARFAEITRASNVVINGHEMVVVADTDKIEFTYNLDPSGEPTGTPAIYFEVDGAAITYITDVDPSNSTLSIVVTNETGGETITVDDALSETSENPVQNKVITAALGGLKPTYEFGFTVTTGQTEDELIVTPDSGSTYAAIAAALAETPNVYAVLDLGFQNQVIRALFSIDSTASGAESTSASAMFWSGTKWMGARLIVSASGEGIIVRET